MERIRPRKYLRRRRKPLLSDWMVVRTKPNKERYAAKNVRRQGHEVFCPFLREQDKFKEVPLFAGFIFVRGPDWYYLKSTYGVQYPIMIGASPARMPLKEMRALLKQGGEDDVITLGLEKFSKGQAIKFRRTAWLGHIGVYNSRVVGKDRIKILLALFGGHHEIECDPGDITAAIPPQGEQYWRALEP